MLDAEEYLHLAIEAMQKNEGKTALEYLHECIALDPENAQATYLLAAEHAEIGLFDRATEGMEKALSLDPNIEMAALQLGMLHLRTGNNARAIELWQGLQEKTNDESLRLISEGLTLLSNESIDEGKEKLLLGMEKNLHNPALNISITSILEHLEANLPKNNNGETENAPKKQAAENSEPVYLGAYKDSSLSND